MSLMKLELEVFLTNALQYDTDQVLIILTSSFKYQPAKVFLSSFCFVLISLLTITDYF